MEWNKAHPVKCDTCEYFEDTDPHRCLMHDKGTQPDWTCADHLAKAIKGIDRSDMVDAICCAYIHKAEPVSKERKDEMLKMMAWKVLGDYEKGDKLLGDYRITDKGELALKDKEIADLKQQLESERGESDFWYSRKEEIYKTFWERESEMLKLKETLRVKDDEIAELKALRNELCEDKGRLLRRIDELREVTK